MKKIIFLIVSVNLVLVTGQLVLANLRAGDGDKLAKVQVQIDSLTSQNNQFESQIFAASSLSHIQSQAQSQNFKSITVVHLSPADLAVASNLLRP